MSCSSPGGQCTQVACGHVVQTPGFMSCSLGLSWSVAVCSAAEDLRAATSVVARPRNWTVLSGRQRSRPHNASISALDVHIECLYQLYSPRFSYCKAKILARFAHEAIHQPAPTCMDVLILLCLVSGQHGSLLLHSWCSSIPLPHQHTVVPSCSGGRFP